MKKTIPHYTVIRDTREKNGWMFSKYDKCAGMESGTLHTGDYTLRGFEEVVCVERKASVSELAINLGKKKKAFYAEMQRIKDYPFKFLVFEFSFSDLAEYPYSLLTEDEKRAYFEYLVCRGTVNEVRKPPIGKRLEIVEKGKVTGKYLTKCLMEIQIWYDTKIMFCDNKENAFLVCNSLFKRLNELFHKGGQDVKY